MLRRKILNLDKAIAIYFPTNSFFFTAIIGNTSADILADESNFSFT